MVACVKNTIESLTITDPASEENSIEKRESTLILGTYEEMF